MTTFRIQAYKPSTDMSKRGFRPKGRARTSKNLTSAIAVACEVSRPGDVAEVVVTEIRPDGSKRVRGCAIRGEFSNINPTPQEAPEMSKRTTITLKEICAASDAQIAAINSVERTQNPTKLKGGKLAIALFDDKAIEKAEKPGKDQYRIEYARFLLGERIYTRSPKSQGLDAKQGLKLREDVRGLVMDAAGVASVVPFDTDTFVAAVVKRDVVIGPQASPTLRNALTEAGVPVSAGRAAAKQGEAA